MIRFIVIANRANNDRYENIIRQQHILGHPIEIFDAVMGNHVEALSKYDANMTIHTDLLPNELGCYLSHFMIMKTLLFQQQQQQFKPHSIQNYTVIFEDDFSIVDITSSFYDRVVEIIHQVQHLDIDIVHLGTICEHKGGLFRDDIYHINATKHLWGMHAYLIRNRSLSKIANALLQITNPIDVKFRELYGQGRLRGLTISPSLVIQNALFASTIRAYCPTTNYITNIDYV